MSLLNFDGKVVVVSGIGPGLGAALAIKFAEAGADVVLAARTQSRLDEVARQIAATGRRALAVATDITDEASAANLVERATEEFGGIDVLVNNAFSIPSMKSLEKTDYQHIRDSVELTVVGTLRLTQRVAAASLNRRARWSISTRWSSGIRRCATAVTRSPRRRC